MVSGLACYPINLDAQREWHGRFFQAPEPHPAPLVPARNATPEEMSSAARTAGAMRNLALSNGWRSNVTYAHGTTMMANGKPGRLVESLALRMRYPAEVSGKVGAVAVWYGKPAGGWGLDLARVWPCSWEAFPIVVTADELKFTLTHVSTVIDQPDSWRWRSMARMLEGYKTERDAERARKAAGRKGQAVTYSIMDETHVHVAGQTELSVAA